MQLMTCLCPAMNSGLAPPPAASIWFEIWGVVDLGNKNLDFSRQISKKCGFFQAISHKKFAYASKFPKKIDFSRQIFEKFHFFQQLDKKFRFSRQTLAI